MAEKIDTVSARNRLQIRREPYWARVRKGCFVGFRKTATGSVGTWIARALDANSAKQKYSALGTFEDEADSGRFDSAVKAATVWFDHLDRGGVATVVDIRETCKRYAAHVESTKGETAAKDVRRRFNSYVLDDPAFASIPLSKLAPHHVEAWRTRLKNRPTTSGGQRGKTRTAGTLNRDVTPFRASLNLALSDGLVISDFAWRKKLTPIKNADGTRTLYLDRDQRRRLIEAAQPDAAAFLRALSLLPIRPGAMAQLTVGDYDRRQRVLKIGTDKAGAGRRVRLPQSTATFLDAMAKDKLPNAFLFTRADGTPWCKDNWKIGVRSAVAAASLPPATSAYTLRHSIISDLVHNGLDVVTVSQLSGTSVRMIEATYSHLRSEIASDALARLAL